MTDAPSAPALPGAHRGARPAGPSRLEAAGRGRAAAAGRVLAGALGCCLLAAVHPPAAFAQEAQDRGAPARDARAATPPESGGAIGVRLADAGVTAPRGQAAGEGPAPAPAPAGGAAAPDPRFGPEDVVGIVLDALARAADAGPGGAADARPVDGPPAAAAGSPFALVFAFASPGNRAAAGSLEQFEAMVREDAYRPLLRHRRAARGALHVEGDRATQRVLVTSARGERVAYTFVLVRQSAGAQRGCWLTESVTREAPSRLGAPFAA